MAITLLLYGLLFAVHGRSLYDSMDPDFEMRYEEMVVEMANTFKGFKENCIPHREHGCVCISFDVDNQRIVENFVQSKDCIEEIEYVEAKNIEKRFPSVETRAIYDKVVVQLNQSQSYLANCFPRPKGCLCVIGTDKHGRQVTERRKNDVDCKVQTTRIRTQMEF